MNIKARHAVLVLLLVVPACFASAPPQTAGLAEGRPGRNLYPEEEPGFTRPVTPRAYELAPPVVSHSTNDLNITRGVNDCFDCHQTDDEVEPDHRAVKVPASHYENPFTGEKVAGQSRVVGSRVMCTQCHVPQAAGEPRNGAVRP